MEEAKARAIRLGLEAASYRGITKALFLSDCSILVNNLNARASDLPMGARLVALDFLLLLLHLSPVSLDTSAELKIVRQII